MIYHNLTLDAILLFMAIAVALLAYIAWQIKPRDNGSKTLPSDKQD